MDRWDSLEKRYKLMKWPMEPGDERAVARFNSSRELFRSLIREHPSFEGAREKHKVALLDVCAGTGIAASAMAKALSEEGIETKITAVDARKSDLLKIEEWLKFAGLKSVEFEIIAADAEELPDMLKGNYDVILIWGSSMPHFDPWSAAKIIAGIKELSNRDSVLLIEQRDIKSKLLLANQFRRILIEGAVEENGSAISPS